MSEEPRKAPTMSEQTIGERIAATIKRSLYAADVVYECHEDEVGEVLQTAAELIDAELERMRGVVESMQNTASVVSASLNDLNPSEGVVRYAVKDLDASYRLASKALANPQPEKRRGASR